MTTSETRSAVRRETAEANTLVAWRGQADGSGMPGLATLAGFWIRARQNVGAMIGLGLLLLLVVTAVFAPAIAPYDPLKLDVINRFQPPSAGHLFGTDELGRDLFSRVVVGTRISFRVAAEVLLVAGSVGVVMGIVSGYRGGLADEVIMRLADVFFAFPSFLLAMAIVAALGAGIQNAVLAIAIAWWPRYARLLRGQVLSVRGEPYVDAARSIGATDFRIMRQHILPNCLAPLIIQLTMDAGSAILTTSALSFIGLGANPPTPEWGLMIAQSRDYIMSYWWVPTFPGVAISVTVAGSLFLGDGLRDLWDPKLRGRSFV
jgi:peptide/nickel transport system permease protein